FERPWKGFGPQKNMALSLAASTWVFSIDADERVSPELASEIKSVVSEPAFDAYRVKRKNIYRGRWVRRCGWWPDEVLRLFKREKARFTDRAVHEAVEYAGPTGILENPLEHYSYNGARDFIRRVERYSTLGAHQKSGRRKSAGALNILARTLLAFLRSYILKKGFLEGRTGLLIAFSTAEVTFYKYMLLSEINEENEKKG
ncbi:MAG: glycosyltransferase family 2 protein, partial [Deltaproteobacteria bacterium]|nr:glycosyltransferase family 2 protein [Deltaproteobacteria bacterium]